MKLNFSKEFIGEVRSKNDIIDVASDYFNLEKSGPLYRTRCKHKGGDKLPSLFFFPDTQTFYCFGCHAGKRNEITSGSDVISFIQWMENISWQDSVMCLANRAGIKIPDAELTKEERDKQKLYDELTNANLKYWKRLHEHKVHGWFTSKGMDETDIRRWRLGVDQDVPTYAIMDEYGRTVGFSRRMGTEGSKYMHDKTTPVFKRGNILYGLNFVKKEIRKFGYVILVEGFNDAILLQKYGLPAVAIMGTSISEGQIILLKKYTNKVILFLDGDTPGEEASKSCAKELYSQELNVDIIIFAGQDPDDIANRYKEGTRDIVEGNAVDACQYIINKEIASYLNSLLLLKKKTMGNIENVIEFYGDSINKELYNSVAYRTIIGGHKDGEYN
jgi:DNA primase